MELNNPNGCFCSFLSIFLQFILLCSVCLTILLHSSTTIYVSALGNETEKFALLKLKDSISGHDPRGILSSWNDSVHFCSWRGIICFRGSQRTAIVDLSGQSLRGTISPFIGNLSFLRALDLRNNSFYGEIPQQIGNLLQLRYLNLRTNILEGKVTANLSRCLELKVLMLRDNELVGTIPMELGALTKLERFSLASNNLRGGIPPSLGNVSSLQSLILDENDLTGNVPEELGGLKNLSFFALEFNNFSGKIPLSIFNLSSMIIFSVTVNQFEGTIPTYAGLNLPNLEYFHIGGNKFSGVIPYWLSNSSHIKSIDLSKNNFSGKFPSNFGKLKLLSSLNLYRNNLGSYSANSLDLVMEPLTNCSQLRELNLGRNNFRGVLPNSIANLSTQMSRLYLSFNQISGSFPKTLENLVNLTVLVLKSNLFAGVIPASFGKLHNLQFVLMDNNKFSGTIPESIGNLSRIFALALSDNKLEGKIPSSIKGCRNLQFFSLSNNSLTEAIPREIFSLSLLITLNLSRNSLTSNLPEEVGSLKHVLALDFAFNNLNGEIPATIGNSESLELLNLRGNFFRGAVPSSLASLRGLQYLDLSRNNLTGKIPIDLEKLLFLEFLDLSFNHFEGEVPDGGVFQNTSEFSVAGNTKICGGVTELQLPRCATKESKHGLTSRLTLTIVTVLFSVVFFILFGFFIMCFRRKSQRESSFAYPKISFLSKVSYKSLYQATNGFSPNLLIGSGSFGSVYKGTLGQSKNLVAIKVLNLHQKGAAKSFIAECNALRNVKHRNLVKILSCCSSIDYNGNEFKALVFEYMPNGSLDQWLRIETTDNESQSRSLNLIQRLNILINVASAIQYLHEDCDQPIIHCDLKPSNVLLDNEMVAHVGDFGLARLISNTANFSDTQTSTAGIKGTIGYAAPEYAMGCEPSRQGDIYSYGILVLEMFTGKRPTDEMFRDDFNLRNFVRIALPGSLAEIVDSALLPRQVEERRCDNNGMEDGISEFEKSNRMSSTRRRCLISVLEIGLACSEDSPSERMNIKDVTKEMLHIRNAYTKGV